MSTNMIVLGKQTPSYKDYLVPIGAYCLVPAKTTNTPKACMIGSMVLSKIPTGCYSMLLSTNEQLH